MAFEGGLSRLIRDTPRPAGSIWGIHHPLWYILSSATANRLELYCSALLGWIGLGAVASDRGRRYCVKGFGVRPLQQKPLCLSLYMQHPELERYWGSILWQAVLPLLDIFGPFFTNTHVFYHMYLPAWILQQWKHIHLQLNKSWFWMCCRPHWVIPIISNKPLLVPLNHGATSKTVLDVWWKMR